MEHFNKISSESIALVDAYKSATKHVRFIFFVINIASVILLIGFYNYRITWLQVSEYHFEQEFIKSEQKKTIKLVDSLHDQFYFGQKDSMIYLLDTIGATINKYISDSTIRLQSNRIITEIKKGKSDSVGINIQLANLQALKNIALMNDWEVNKSLHHEALNTDMKFVDLPIIGIEVYIEDLPFLGAFGVLSIFCWYYFARRRQKGLVLAIKNKICELCGRGMTKMLFDVDQLNKTKFQTTETEGEWKKKREDMQLQVWQKLESVYRNSDKIDEIKYLYTAVMHVRMFNSIEGIDYHNNIYEECKQDKMDVMKSNTWLKRLIFRWEEFISYDKLIFNLQKQGFGLIKFLPVYILFIIILTDGYETFIYERSDLYKLLDKEIETQELRSQFYSPDSTITLWNYLGIRNDIHFFEEFHDERLSLEFINIRKSLILQITVSMILIIFCFIVARATKRMLYELEYISGKIELIVKNIKLVENKFIDAIT